MKAVKPGGWGPLFVPTAPELAAIDATLIGGIDSSSLGDTVTGNLSLLGDPNQPSIHPGMGGQVSVSGAGAVFGTGAGGSLLCGTSPPTYTSPRPRVVRYSALEMTPSAPVIGSGQVTSGTAQVIDPNTGGVSQAVLNTGGLFCMPLPKTMDGSTITAVRIWFYVPSLPAGTSGSLQLAFFAFQQSTGLSGYVGLTSVNVGAISAASWYNSGKPQSIFVSTTAASAGTDFLGATFAGSWGAGSNVMDLTNWTYSFQVTGPTTSTSGLLPNPIFTAVEMTYSVPDERFPL